MELQLSIWNRFINLQFMISIVNQIKLKYSRFSKSRKARAVGLTALASFSSKIISMITGIISVPLTLNYLGSERYGLWMAISSILTVINFADLGIGNGLLNLISKAFGRQDISLAKTSVSSSFFTLFGLSILFQILFWIAYPFLNWEFVFNLTSPVAINEVGKTVIIVFVYFSVSMPLGIVQRVQLGNQEGYRFELFSSLGSILNLVFTLCAIKLKLGLPFLAAAFLLGSIIANIVNGIHYFYFSKWKSISPSVKDFSLSNSIMTVKVGLIFLLLQVFTIVGNSFDQIIVSHFAGASEVTNFALVKKIFLYTNLSQFIIQPLWPVFGEALAKRDYKWAKETLIRVIKASLIYGSLFTLPILFFGNDIISLWTHKEVNISFMLYFGMFIWSFLVNYGGVMSSFLNSSDLVQKQIYFIAPSAISSVIFQIIFTKYWGSIGCIYGLLLGYALFYIYPSYKLAFNYLDKSSLNKL